MRATIEFERLSFSDYSRLNVSLGLFIEELIKFKEKWKDRGTIFLSYEDYYDSNGYRDGYEDIYVTVVGSESDEELMRRYNAMKKRMEKRMEKEKRDRENEELKTYARLKKKFEKE